MSQIASSCVYKSDLVPGAVSDWEAVLLGSRLHMWQEKGQFVISPTAHLRRLRACVRPRA